MSKEERGHSEQAVGETADFYEPGTPEHLRLQAELDVGGIGTDEDLRKLLIENQTVRSIALALQVHGHDLNRALPSHGILIGDRQATHLEVRLWPGIDKEPYSQENGEPIGITAWAEYFDPYGLLAYRCGVSVPLAVGDTNRDFRAWFRAAIQGAPDVNMDYIPDDPASEGHPVMAARIIKGIASQLAEVTANRSPL